MRPVSVLRHARWQLAGAFLGLTSAWTALARGQTAVVPPAEAAPAPAVSAAPPVAAAPPPVSIPDPPASSTLPAPAATAGASVAGAAPSPTETSAEVLRLYVAEDDAGALRTVQAGLERCDVSSRRDCPDSGKALLLRDLGVVQAGAYRDHAAAVAAFREALRLDPNVTIPADLLVDRVSQAFVEAGGKVRATPPPPSEGKGTTSAAVAPEATAAETLEPEQKSSRYDVGDAFVLVVGSWGGGGDSSGNFVGEWGGAISSAWHVAGPLAVGARINAGGTGMVTSSSGTISGPYGLVGAAALLGVLPRGKRNTGYFLLGIGPDYLPELGTARTVVSLAAGVSFGGFSFGGMPAFSYYEGRSSAAGWLFVGWGNYVKD